MLEPWAQLANAFGVFQLLRTLRDLNVRKDSIKWLPIGCVRSVTGDISFP